MTFHPGLEVICGTDLTCNFFLPWVRRFIISTKIIMTGISHVILYICISYFSRLCQTAPQRKHHIVETIIILFTSFHNWHMSSYFLQTFMYYFLNHSILYTFLKLCLQSIFVLKSSHIFTIIFYFIVSFSFPKPQ